MRQRILRFICWALGHRLTLDFHHYPRVAWRLRCTRCEKADPYGDGVYR